MKIRVSAAATEEVAPRIPPLGQQPLGKGFPQLANKSSIPHLSPHDEDGPASGEASLGEEQAAGKKTKAREPRETTQQGERGRPGVSRTAGGSVVSGRAARLAGDQSQLRSAVADDSPSLPRQPNPLQWSSGGVQRASAAAAPKRRDYIYYQVSRQLRRYLRESRKPPVVVVSESAESELLRQAVGAFGSSPSLRDVANLVISFPGVPSSDQSGRCGSCPQHLLLAIDRYDLYGHIAILRPQNSRDEVTELLRIARDRGGVLLADGTGNEEGENEARRLLMRLSSALRVPVVTADGGGSLDGQDRVERQGSPSRTRDSLTQKRKLGPVARIHALLA